MQIDNESSFTTWWRGVLSYHYNKDEGRAVILGNVSIGDEILKNVWVNGRVDIAYFDFRYQRISELFGVTFYINTYNGKLYPMTFEGLKQCFEKANTKGFSSPETWRFYDAMKKFCKASKRQKIGFKTLFAFLSYCNYTLHYEQVSKIREVTI